MHSLDDWRHRAPIDLRDAGEGLARLSARAALTVTFGLSLLLWSGFLVLVLH